MQFKANVTFVDIVQSVESSIRRIKIQVVQISAKHMPFPFHLNTQVVWLRIKYYTSGPTLPSFNETMRGIVNSS